MIINFPKPELTMMANFVCMYGTDHDIINWNLYELESKLK